MTTRDINFLWLNLDLPAKPDPADGSINPPMPEKYIEKICAAGARHRTASFALWVDSKRLTQKQMDYLKQSIETDNPNVQLKDLRSIPAYNGERLYNYAETDPYWREGLKRSVIWRQVDCAKILVCLQGNADQTFFTDIDRAHMDYEAENVQTMLDKQGIMIGSTSSLCRFIENQLWGFTARRREFFTSYYDKAIKEAHKGNNAYSTLYDKVNDELVEKEQQGIAKYCLFIEGDNTEAHHPGHAYSKGKFKELDVQPSLTAKFAKAIMAWIKSPLSSAQKKHEKANAPGTHK